MVVLDSNPLQMEPSALRDLRVTMTIVGGREMYARP
jgi:predicted amidohydrolase YtcJ